MKLLQSLEKQFNAAQDPSLAPQMKAYMRDLFPFLGIKKPQRAALQKSCFKAHPVTTEQELITIVTLLWDKPEREYQMVACELLYSSKKLWFPALLATVEQLIRTKSWWDSVDTLASKTVGPLLLKFPELQVHMDKWITDENFWIRRSALIYQLSYKEKTDADRLFSYCKMTCHEKEFFIRKAIGWALRQYAKTDPLQVRAFLVQHKDSLSGLSYREAAKYCFDFPGETYDEEPHAL
jgi:3-methyladenine DNA glycosylase AlkD